MGRYTSRQDGGALCGHGASDADAACRALALPHSSVPACHLPCHCPCTAPAGRGRGRLQGGAALVEDCAAGHCGGLLRGPGRRTAADGCVVACVVSTPASGLGQLNARLHSQPTPRKQCFCCLPLPACKLNPHYPTHLTHPPHSRPQLLRYCGTEPGPGQVHHRRHRLPLRAAAGAVRMGCSGRVGGCPQASLVLLALPC